MRWLAVAFAALLAIAPASAAAAEFAPTRFNDPPPNGCKPSDCSLREAIRAANNHGGPDTVSLSRGKYEMEIADNTGTGIEAGDFNLSGNLTIDGRGPKKTKVDANGLDRVFTAAGKTKFQGLTITGGDSSANAGHTDVGGGITALGDKVKLKNVVVRENEAQLGGGVESFADQLTIQQSIFRFNHADEGGGLDLRSSDTPPQTDIRASTFSVNVAANKGGGILADGAPMGVNTQEPFLTIVNSTFYNNVASGGPGPFTGGGIMADNNAIVSLDASTVTLNLAGDASPAGIGTGGGLYQHSGAVFNPGDSIIARNFVGTGTMASSTASGAQCAGTLNGSGGNLVQSPFTGCTLTGGYDSTTDPKLGPLADNGGPTRTVALLTGSPAIGLATSCPPKDQRGVTRPVQGCDTGAFEKP